MNEYFASSADIHRILGILPEGADKMPTADGREKTVEASRARLARMIGREADEAAALEWDGLAPGSRKRRTRKSPTRLPCACPAMTFRSRRRWSPPGSGKASPLRSRAACGGPASEFSSLIGAPAEASHSAPAVAVAMLAARAFGL